MKKQTNIIILIPIIFYLLGCATTMKSVHKANENKDISKLIGFLDDKNEIKNEAKQILLKNKIHSVPKMISALTKKNDKIKIELIKILTEMKEYQAIENIGKLLDSSNSDVIKVVIYSLEEYGNEHSYKKLIDGVSGEKDEAILNIYKDVLMKNVDLTKKVLIDQLNEKQNYDNFKKVISKLGNEYWINNISLNFRSGPGSKYKILDSLSFGEKIIIIEKMNKWYGGFYDNKYGYVYGNFITDDYNKISSLKEKLSSIYIDDTSGSYAKKKEFIKNFLNAYSYDELLQELNGWPGLAKILAKFIDGNNEFEKRKNRRTIDKRYNDVISRIYWQKFTIDGMPEYNFSLKQYNLIFSHNSWKIKGLDNIKLSRRYLNFGSLKVNETKAKTLKDKRIEGVLIFKLTGEMEWATKTYASGGIYRPVGSGWLETPDKAKCKVISGKIYISGIGNKFLD